MVSGQHGRHQAGLQVTQLSLVSTSSLQHALSLSQEFACEGQRLQASSQGPHVIPLTDSIGLMWGVGCFPAGERGCRPLFNPLEGAQGGCSPLELLSNPCLFLFGVVWEQHGHWPGSSRAGPTLTARDYAGDQRKVKPALTARDAAGDQR